MASVVPYRDGYRAYLHIKGVRETKTFRTKREAIAWSSARETQIESDSGKAPAQLYTLRRTIEKYRDEETPKKRGKVKETIRLNALLNSYDLPLDIPVGEVTETHLSAYRDSRLKVVKPASVLRELGALSAMFETVRLEWKWITRNPVQEIRKPPRTKHRERVIYWHEIRSMLKSLGYSRTCKTMTGAVAYSFLIALRTGMRAGEVCALRWDQVKADHLTNVGTKTDSRNVALSRQAKSTIERLRTWDSVHVVAITPKTLDALFRRHRDRSGLAGFTFHDSRHTAATWMAKKLHVLDLCKQFGWSSTSRALTYYNPTASDISKRL
jgi:integrase